MALQKIYYRGNELYSPKYDRVFKAMFISSDLTRLAEFMSCILSLDIKADGIAVKSPVLSDEHKDGKLVCLDLKVVLADKSIINVEIQVNDEKNMGKRSIYNASLLMDEQLKSGEDYVNICPVITINILDYSFLDNHDYHNRFRLKNIKTNEEMPDANVFEINFIELPKLPKKTGNDKKLLWLKFLSAKTEEDLDMVVAQDPKYEPVVEKLISVNANEELREYMLLQEKIERDERWKRASGEAKAEERGIERALALIEEGVSLAEARKMLGVKSRSPLKNGKNKSAAAKKRPYKRKP